MRPAITTSLILISSILSGQTQEISDTINIREILVKGNAVSSVVNGFRTTHVDTSCIKDNSLGDLSDIISEGTTLFVKNYGPSGAAISYSANVE
jgi:hypothetical protein